LDGYLFFPLLVHFFVKHGERATIENLIDTLLIPAVKAHPDIAALLARFGDWVQWDDSGPVGCIFVHWLIKLWSFVFNLNRLDAGPLEMLWQVIEASPEQVRDDLIKSIFKYLDLYVAAHRDSLTNRQRKRTPIIKHLREIQRFLLLKRLGPQCTFDRLHPLYDITIRYLVAKWTFSELKRLPLAVDDETQVFEPVMNMQYSVAPKAEIGPEDLDLARIVWNALWGRTERVRLGSREVEATLLATLIFAQVATSCRGDIAEFCARIDRVPRDLKPKLLAVLNLVPGDDRVLRNIHNEFNKLKPKPENLPVLSDIAGVRDQYKADFDRYQKAFTGHFLKVLAPLRERRAILVGEAERVNGFEGFLAELRQRPGPFFQAAPEIIVLRPKPGVRVPPVELALDRFETPTPPLSHAGQSLLCGDGWLCSLDGTAPSQLPFAADTLWGVSESGTIVAQAAGELVVMGHELAPEIRAATCAAVIGRKMILVGRGDGSVMTLEESASVRSITHHHSYPVIAISGSLSLGLIVSVDDHANVVFQSTKGEFINIVKVQLATLSPQVKVFKSGTVAVSVGRSVVVYNWKGTVLKVLEFRDRIKVIEKHYDTANELLFVAAANYIDLFELRRYQKLVVDGAEQSFGAAHAATIIAPVKNTRAFLVTGNEAPTVLLDYKKHIKQIPPG
jgi:hypothetical protein